MTPEGADRGTASRALGLAAGSDDVGCVEVALQAGKAGVGDCADYGTGPVLEFTAYQWRCLIEGAGDGESGLPGVGRALGLGLACGARMVVAVSADGGRGWRAGPAGPATG